ncbi:hypothetical protein GCM10022296_03440 [Secundilactobacillus similis DSM 23365 = JCM 2765]|uniref:Uncharacterized protein n=1 Tax=Secundilactobacillus similis DSM 23365 = JCM 2765 TaxID=1423804 RepID=A0A0R2EZJ6_9LACO|nr:hypothetical protein [Secundilactobacillus similis]KRN21776.1 hypothetical protein FD14_GL000960 [Secundilactobacillus similis DSM 23365 = JCM 2765]
MMNKWQVIVGGVLLVIVGSLIWQRPFQTNGQTSEQALVQRLDRDAMMTAVKQPLLQIPETETPKAVSVQPETKKQTAVVQLWPALLGLVGVGLLFRRFKR